MTLKLNGLWRLCNICRASLALTLHPFLVSACFRRCCWALHFVFFLGPGICKKKYPFKNWGPECPNPPPDSSKLKVYSRAACRSSEIKYPFCNSVFGRHTFSTLTQRGEGWIGQEHEYGKGTFFLQIPVAQPPRRPDLSSLEIR